MLPDALQVGVLAAVGVCHCLVLHALWCCLPVLPSDAVLAVAEFTPRPRKSLVLCRLCPLLGRLLQHTLLCTLRGSAYFSLSLIIHAEVRLQGPFVHLCATSVKEQIKQLGSTLILLQARFGKHPQGVPDSPQKVAISGCHQWLPGALTPNATSVADKLMSIHDTSTTNRLDKSLQKDIGRRCKTCTTSEVDEPLMAPPSSILFPRSFAQLCCSCGMLWCAVVFTAPLPPRSCAVHWLLPLLSTHCTGAVTAAQG